MLKFKLDPSTAETFAATATPQRVFDYVVAKLSEQGGPSRTVYDNMCVYRSTTKTGETRACAVGVLIPDKLYEPGMDRGDFGYSFTVDKLFNHFPQLRYLDSYGQLLTDLQWAHDMSKSSVTLARSEFAKVAKNHNLKSAMVSGIRVWDLPK